MTEPTGHRIDGTPWEEARPPHIPDRVARLGPWTFLFLAAALLHLGVVFQEWTRLGPLAPPSALVDLASGRITAIIASLYGVALFVRHPDARWTMPLLAFGVGLFALVELLGLIADPVIRFLDSLAPRADTGALVSPSVAAWSVLTTLISIFAVLYTASGIGRARVRPDPSVARPIGMVLAVVVALTMVVWIATVPWSDVAADVGTMLTLVIGLALALGSTAAWAYLFGTVLVGSIAGESPPAAWLTATLAATLFLGLRLLGGLPFDLSGLFAVFAVATVLSWLLLLVAFALGLPATSPTSATADRPAATPPGSAGS